MSAVEQELRDMNRIESIESALTTHDCRWATDRMKEGHTVQFDPTLESRVREDTEYLVWRLDTDGNVECRTTHTEKTWSPWGTVEAWQDHPISGRRYKIHEQD